MPVVYSNPAFPNQVSSSQTVQSYATQLNFRSMIQEVTQWNPNVDPMVAGRWLNNYYRNIIDRRSWYALKLRGQISVPNTYNQGIALFTYQSPIVIGTGTNWTQAMVGQQIRTGFTYPLQTIVKVIDATHLQLDMPFGGNTQSAGYNIFTAYVVMGGNIKRFLWAVNQQQGWPMNVNVPVESINFWDVWRISIGWSTHFAVRPPTPDGQYQIEIWPLAYQNQVFPFEAYQQPVDMTLDTDTPLAWIRSDILVSRAIADAMMFGGRKSDFYDPTTAQMKIAQFNADAEAMEQADNDMDQRDVMWDYGEEDGESGPNSLAMNSTWAQNHG